MTTSPHNETFWDQRETFSRDQLESYQLAALKRQLGYVDANSVYYQKKFAEVGFKPGDFNGFEDLKRLPLTKKVDYVAALSNDPPFGDFLAVDRENLARIHFSSGTSAKPAPQFWSARDLERWADLYARYAYAQGVRRGDIFQCLFTYSWFVGGLGATAGYQRLGAAVIPAGSQDTERQIRTMFEFGSTVICGTPSFMVYLGEVAKKLGYDPADSKVHSIMVGGEPGGNIPATRQRIEKLWDARCYDAYGSLEFQTIGFDCPERQGPHVAEDFVYAEVLDAKTGNDVADGEPGVLVLTHLDKEAGPLVRWWTGDVVVRDQSPCSCGRTHARLLGGVKGRADDMLIVRGVNVFPSAVEEIVRGTDGFLNEYRLIVDDSVRDPDSGLLKGIRIQAEVEDGADQDALSAVLAAAIKEKLNIRATVQAMPQGSLPRTEHKASRLVVQP